MGPAPSGVDAAILAVVESGDCQVVLLGLTTRKGVDAAILAVVEIGDCRVVVAAAGAKDAPSDKVLVV
jgi:predicted short-subunit dehydrogenase-like oxidoreductase (DUF2520 family)